MEDDAKLFFNGVTSTIGLADRVSDLDERIDQQTQQMGRVDISQLTPVGSGSTNKKRTKFFSRETNSYFRLFEDPTDAFRLAAILDYFKDHGIFPSMKSARLTVDDKVVIEMEQVGSNHMTDRGHRAFYALGEKIGQLHSLSLVKNFPVSYQAHVNTAVLQYIESLSDLNHGLCSDSVLIDAEAKEKLLDRWEELSRIPIQCAWDLPDCRKRNIRVLYSRSQPSVDVRIVDLESVKPTFKGRSLHYMMHDWRREKGLTQKQFTAFCHGYEGSGADLSDLKSALSQEQESVMTFLLFLGRIRNGLDEYKHLKEGGDKIKGLCCKELYRLREYLLAFSPNDPEYVRLPKYFAALR